MSDNEEEDESQQQHQHILNNFVRYNRKIPSVNVAEAFISNLESLSSNNYNDFVMKDFVPLFYSVNERRRFNRYGHLLLSMMK